LNNLFLLGLIACILSILLVTSASAKELRINLTESLDVNGNDKKPKDKTKEKSDKTKTKLDKTKTKSDKTKEKVKKLEKTKTKKAKNPTNMKTKSNTVKNLGNIR